jgi:hypothetical protein
LGKKVQSIQQEVSRKACCLVTRAADGITRHAPDSQLTEAQRIYGAKSNFQWLLVACANVDDPKRGCYLAHYVKGSHPALVDLIGEQRPDGSVKASHQTTSAMYAASHVQLGTSSTINSR